jgi:nucleoside-diphosphate-sugar epimerase
VKNIIIVGSNSIIAQNFCSEQQRDEFKFLRISRNENIINANSKHILYDLSRPFSIDDHESLLAQIRSSIDLNLDRVLCLFAWSGTPRSSTNLSLSEAIKLDNYNILTNTLSLIRDLDLSQIVFLSSAGGIYNNDEASSHNERSTPRPATPYGLQKLNAESMLAQFARKLQVPFCAYRISCAYGFNRFCPDQGVLNKWIFDGLLHGEINIYNSLDSELNFVGYDQLSRAFELGIKLNLQGIFNIGTSYSTSLSRIYIAVTNRIPDLRVNIVDTKKRYLNIDCAKFKAATGFEFESKIEHDFSVIFNTIKSMCINVSPVSLPRIDPRADLHRHP